MAGIYIHIPFCHSKCAYCDFYSLARTDRITAYTAALKMEWMSRRAELGDEAVRTIYLGGGTPSLLPGEALLDIAGWLPKDYVEEFTLEVNPEDVNAGAVKTWLSAGVNRVSMGVQSLVDSELAAVGRRHSAAEALKAIECLKGGGIENISCDLIYGLPGQTAQSWQHSIDTLLASGITHLSAYCLSYEPGTRLYLKRERGEVEEADDELIEEMYKRLCSAARMRGFRHYEISNFALAGYESRHNSSYWTGIPYLGLGPGAHSLGVDGVRRYVPSSLKTYLADPSNSAVVDEETELDRLNDRLLISLRTAAGLDLTALTPLQYATIETAAAPHLRAGRLVKEAGVLRVPEEAWLVCDLVLRDLFFED